MAIAVRYSVDDVDATIALGVGTLGFELEMHPAPVFAVLSREGLRLMENRPGSSGAGRALDRDATPLPGGWDRLQLEAENRASLVERLKLEALDMRSEIIEGKSGRQILVDDPSSNPIEPARR